MGNIKRCEYRHDMLYAPERIVIRVCNLDGAGSVEREVEYVPAEQLAGAMKERKKLEKAIRAAHDLMQQGRIMEARVKCALAVDLYGGQ